MPVLLLFGPACAGQPVSTSAAAGGVAHAWLYVPSAFHSWAPAGTCLVHLHALLRHLSVQELYILSHVFVLARALVICLWQCDCTTPVSVVPCGINTQCVFVSQHTIYLRLLQRSTAARSHASVHVFLAARIPFCIISAMRSSALMPWQEITFYCMPMGVHAPGSIPDQVLEVPRAGRRHALCTASAHTFAAQPCLVVVAQDRIGQDSRIL